MGKMCPLCGGMTFFYIWSTDRYFNLNKYIDVKKRIVKKNKISIVTDGEPVCQHCVHKYGLLNR